MNKCHSDLYTFIKELRKEQGATEISVVELFLGRKIKASPKKKWLDNQNRLQRIVKGYDDSEDILAYLETVGHIIVL